MIRDSIIRGALYLTAPGTGCSIAEGRGVLKGTVATLMDVWCWDFETAFNYVLARLPDDYRPECIPAAWRKYK